jgi:hypothetical protein
MTKPGQQEASGARTVRALLARMIVLVLTIALAAPFPAFSADIALHAGTTSLSAQSDPGEPSQTAPCNYGVMSHAHCGFYQALPLETAAFVPILSATGADYFVSIDPLSSLSSRPPRKPPRI